ncbi:SphA family protein [Sediminicola luteus]|nr:transporter [Sediminicola luteus]
MKKSLIGFFALGLLVFSNVFAQDPITQPQGNYGLTSVLDGAPPMPGLYYMGYASYYSGNLRDHNGDKVTILPGKDLTVNSALLVNQAVWITNTEVFGGNLFFDFLLPTVHLGLPDYDSAPVDLLGKNSILADISVGFGVQWFDKKLFGLKYFHRPELIFLLPTGGYDKAMPVNAGSGFFSIQPTYAQTLFFNEKTSLSLRHHVTFNSEVEKGAGDAVADVKAGTYYHVNYALETLVGKKRFKPGESGETRLAVQGYWGTQFNDDQVNGIDVANSGEKVFAIGPSVHLLTKKGLVWEFKTAIETGVENRTQGVRSTIRLIKVFPPKKK